MDERRTRQPPEPAAPDTIDVCVATHRRPALLAGLLESLAGQRTDGSFAYRVIVVDNDVRRSAAEVVARFARRSVDVAYDVEPERNISRVRNRALAHARATFVATIDDDGVAAPEWLLRLVTAQRRHRADAVLGPVERVLPAGAPAWMRDSGVLELPNPPSGSTAGFVDNTANSLFRRALVDGCPQAFDPGFGRTGGEDTKFFHDLRLRGARLVWEREARVRELFSPERASLLWLLQRSFREGMTSYRVFGRWPAGLDLPRGRWLALALWASRTSARIVARTALSPLLASQRAAAVRDLYRLAFNLGVAANTLGWRVPEHYGA